MKQYFGTLGRWLSAGLMVVFAGWSAIISVSAWSGFEIRATAPGRWDRLRYRVINALFFWQRDHCRGAYVHLMTRLAILLDHLLERASTIEKERLTAARKTASTARRNLPDTTVQRMDSVARWWADIAALEADRQDSDGQAQSNKGSNKK